MVTLYRPPVNADLLTLSEAAGASLPLVRGLWRARSAHTLPSMAVARLNPFRHAVEPATLAGAAAVIGLASFVPLLIVSGGIALILGARIYYNHRGLGDRWNELHRATALADAHLLVSGLLLGALGALLAAFGAVSTVQLAG